MEPGLSSRSSKRTTRKKASAKTAKKKSKSLNGRFEDVNIEPYGETSLRVDADPVRLKPPGRVGPRQVRWVIAADTVPNGGRIAIEFEVQLGTRGPFGPGSANRYGRGRYFLPKGLSMVIFSGDTDVYSNPRTTGEWKYGICVYDEHGIEVRTLDPGVAIDEDESN